MKKQLLFLLLILLCSLTQAQEEPNDCVNAITVCGNGEFSSNAEGMGQEQEISSCGGYESNSLWLKINIVQAGTLGFDLIPNDPNISVDYDFYVFGANKDCDDLGDPIRCATTNPEQSGQSDNHTGMDGNHINTTAGPGDQGDSYVHWLNVQPGESYYIAIDRPEGDGGFQINWIGSAMEGDGAFPTPPDANEVNDLEQCSTNIPGQAIFDLTQLKPEINPNLLDNQVVFFKSLADAIDGVNAIQAPEIISNDENPQTIYAKVTNLETDCYSITEFDLIVYPIPDGSMEVIPQSVCPGGEVELTLTGSENALIEYTLNGGEAQEVILDENGQATVTITVTEEITINLTHASTLDSNGEVLCSQALDDSITVELDSLDVNEELPELETCSDNDTALFDLTVNESELFNDDVDLEAYIFSYYTDYVDAVAGENAINDPTNYENTENPEEIFVRVENDDESDCYAIGSFSLQIYPSGEAYQPEDLSLCNDGSTSDISFDLTQTQEEILGDQEENEFVISFYHTQEDAENGDNSIEDPENYETQDLPETIFVRLGNAESEDCFDTTSFEIKLTHVTVANLEDLEACDDEDLGEVSFDLTVNDANVLGGEPSDDYSIHYYEAEQDAIDGTNAITDSENYEVSSGEQKIIFVRIQKNGTPCFATDSFTVETFPAVIAHPPEDLSACDDGTTQDFSYDLTQTLPEILDEQDPEEFEVGYYQTEIEAHNGTDPIGNPGSYEPQNPSQTIWVRIQNHDHPDCYNLTSFDLETTTVEIGDEIADLEECDGGDTGNATFDLTQVNDDVLDGQSPLDYIITFYTNSDDATDGLNAIEDPQNYENTSNPQTIYVRIEANNLSDCFQVGSFEIEATPSDPINENPTPLKVCDTDNDGFYDAFDLHSKDDEITLDNDNLEVSYHLTSSDAHNNVNAIGDAPYANINPYNQTIYVRVEDEGNHCELFTTIELQVYDSPQLLAETDPLEACDDSGQEDGTAHFDLTSIEDLIFQDENEDPDFYDITYYQSEEDAQVPENAIPNPGTYTNLVPFEQTLWIRVEDPSGPGCFALIPLDLIVHPIPEAVQPDPLELCDNSLSGSDTDETVTFDLTTKNEEIKGGDSSLIISWFETEQDEIDDNPIDDPSAYTNIENAQTIVARVTNQWGCSTTVTLTLVVNPLPTPTPAEDLDDYVVCDDNNDGFAQFDLSTRDDLIANDEANVEITYYATYQAAQGGSITDQLPNDYVNNTPGEQVIYARSTNTETGCYAIVELTLKVVDAPEITDDIDDLFACSADGNDALFDLTQNANQIYGDISPLDFDLYYYESEEDAQNDTNPLGHPEAYSYGGSEAMTIWVRLENSDSDCYAIGSFEITAGDTLEINTPTPLVVCDNNFGDPDDEVGLFDLTLTIPEITGDNNSLSVDFYEDQAGLDNDEPIENPEEYNNITNAQTLPVRVYNSQGCEAFTTLTIEVVPEPNVADELDPLQICDVDNDGFAEFDLQAEIDYILNGQPNVEVTFHLTEATAEAGVNAIDASGPYENTSPNQQTVWVRVENTGSDDVNGTGCYVIRSLDLIVVPSPEIENLEDLYRCDDNHDGFAVFDLTVNQSNIFGGEATPDDVVITYHETQPDAETGTNPIAVPGNYTNVTNPQYIYVRVEDTITGCYDTFDYENDNSFSLYVEETPDLEDAYLSVCDDDENQDPYPQAVFDLSDALEDLTGSPSLPNAQELKYYASQEDLDNDQPIANPNAYVNAENPQDIYVMATNTDTQNECSDQAILTLEVLPLPSPSEIDPDALRLTQCDDDTDGVAADPFDLTQSGAIISGSENVVISYYKTEDAAVDGNTDNPEYIDTPETYINEPAYNQTDANGVPTNIQIVYARVEAGTTGNNCFVIVPIELEVVPAPTLNPAGDPFGYTLCEDGTTGQAQLPLDEIAYNLYDFTNGDPSDLISLLDEDPNTNQDQSLDLADYQITYYTSEADAEEGTNPINPGYIASDGEEIYIRIKNIESGCYNTDHIGKIIITVEPRPSIDAMTITLDPFCSDQPGGNQATIDLTQYDQEVNPNAPTDTEVVYYADLEDYNNGHPIENPSEATLFEGQTVIAEVINTNTLCGSAEYTKINIKVETSPMVDLSQYDGAVICVDLDPVTTPTYGGGDSSLTLDTGLPAAGFTFSWTLDGSPLAQDGPALEVTQSGTYSVTVTNAAGNNCESSDTVIIVEHNPPEFSVQPIKPAFSDHGGILVSHITGQGDYEFKIDDGPWQEANPDGSLTFTDVGPGEHFIHGRDKGGCGETIIPISLIDYPDFFTPNGDGHNDTWNIVGLEDQPEANIYIFDRYGKLLKQIQPDGPGWNGTFNGKQMPSNDYWFKVEYKERSADGFSQHPATFKGHFTLKR